MVLHYITMLGTGLSPNQEKKQPGGYSDAAYIPERAMEADNAADMACVTPYVQLAVYNFYCRGCENDHDEVKVSVFVTDRSEEVSWKDYENPAEGYEFDKRRGLKGIFEENGIRAETVKIKDGRNSAEHWENFRTFCDTIGGDEEIIIDITHSFRTIPLQFIAALNYAKDIKNIRVRGIYYGAFEARSEAGGKMLTPIQDYTDYMLVMGMSNSINSFLDSGTSTAFNDFIKDRSGEAGRNKANIGQNEFKVLKEIKVLCGRISTFTEDIECSRGRNIYEDYKNYKKEFERSDHVIRKVSGITNAEHSIYIDILNYMNKSVEERLFSGRSRGLFSDGIELDAFSEHILSGVLAIEWCMDHNMIQPGLTALRETFTSFIMKLVGCGDKEIGDRNKRRAADNLIGEVWDIKKGGSGKEHSPEADKFNKVLADIMSEADKDSFVSLYGRTADMRNNINHFGFSSDNANLSTVKKNYKKYSEEFLGILVKYKHCLYKNADSGNADRFFAAPQRLYTHGGVFHADEVFATALLNIVFHGSTKVTRGFAPPNDPDCIVYDIGFGRFDHHQKDKEYRENGVPYAAFGLLWREYGRQLMDELSAERFDREFVSVLDAHDNTGSPCPLADAVSAFNPTWESKKNTDECFDEAVKYAQNILKRFIERINSENAAYDRVRALAVGCGSDILVLECFMPWEKAVENTDIRAVIFPSDRGGFNARLTGGALFPEAWGGLPPEELSRVSGIDGLTFCHKGRFLLAGDTAEALTAACRICIDGR